MSAVRAVSALPVSKNPSRTYFTPEALAADNQVFCEGCGLRKDALKGCRLAQLPPVLMLQLKRFDMDEMRERRKRFDYVSFPEVLDMNPFFLLEQPFPPNYCYLQDSPRDIDARHCHLLLSTPTSTLPDHDSAPLEAENAEMAQKHLNYERNLRNSRCSRLYEAYQPHGNEVFELYSVLTHFGSALAGHYLAYIKVLGTGQWLQFNDDKVQEVKESEVFRTFGGAEAGHPCAYVLLYRRMTGETHTNTPVSVPKWLVETFESEQKRVVTAQFRVFSGHEERIISVPVSAYVSELKAESLRAFGQEKKPARLWTYVKDLDLRLESLDLYEHVRVDCLKTLQFAETLSLDLFQSDFSPRNWDEMTVEVRFLKAGAELGDFKAAFVGISAISTISELISELHFLFKLPIGGRIALYRRCPIPTLNDGINLATPEHREKTLAQFCLFPGSILYLEEVISQLKRPRLPELMTREASKRVIRYSGKDCQGVLRVSRMDSLQELKSRISEATGLAESDFYLRKHHAEGEELRDLTDTVGNSGLVSGAGLWLQEGPSASLETCRIHLELASPACCDEDQPWFSYSCLCELIVSLADSIAQLRQKAAKALWQCTGQALPAEQLSLREKYGERPGKALADPLQLRNCVAQTGFKRLSIHILHKNYALTGLKTAVPLSIRLFSPQTYALSSPIDLAVSRETTAGQLERILAALAGARQVQVCRVTFPQGFYRLDLETEEWRDIQGRTELISSFPLYLGERGGFLVIKDAQIDLQPPSPDVLSKYPRPVSEESYEKPVKIHVKRL